MSGYINPITVPSIVGTSEDMVVQAQSEAEQAKQELKPGQPLPGSSVGLSELWRIVQDSMKLAAEAFSGTGVENSEAKKTLIELQKNTQIDALNERMAQIEDQKNAEKKQGIFGKIAMAFSFIAAIVVAPFNPVLAAVMVGFIVAAIVIPKVVDEILIAAGVSEEIRGYVTMGLEIAIGIIGMVVTFNPANFMASASKIAAKGAASVMKVVDKAVDVLNTFKAFRTVSKSVTNAVDKFMKYIQPLLDKLASFAEGGEKVASTVGQVSSMASNMTSVVSTGYGIKSADVAKDLEIAQAEQDEIAVRIEQMLKMLTDALRAVTHAFDSVAKVNRDQREFSEKMISIHM